MLRTSSRDNPVPPMAYLRISGGIFHDMLCHDFDMLHFLTGEVDDDDDVDDVDDNDDDDDGDDVYDDDIDDGVVFDLRDGIFHDM